MRHNKKFNHLGRKSAHRKAMLANMASSLIIHKRFLFVFSGLVSAMKTRELFTECTIQNSILIMIHWKSGCK